jgi:hypothetical protein
MPDYLPNNENDDNYWWLHPLINLISIIILIPAAIFTVIWDNLDNIIF